MVGAPVNGGSARRWTGWFGDLRVGAKIATALAVAMVACGLVALFGGLGLRDVDARSTEIYEENLKPIQQLSDAQRAFEDGLLTVTLMTIASTQAETAKHKQELSKVGGVVDGLLQEYQDLGLAAEQQKLMDDLRTALTAYRNVRTDLLIPAAEASNDVAFESAFDSQAAPLIEQVKNAFDGLAAYESNSAAHASAEATTTYKGSLTLMIIVFLVGLIAAGLLGYVTIRKITKPLAEVADSLGKMAEGDLRGVGLGALPRRGRHHGAARSTGPPAACAPRSPPLGDAAQSLSAAAEQLSATSAQIAGNADAASRQAGVVATAADEVNRNVQVISAGSEEMGAAIREISTNAAQAARVAAQAVHAAESTNRDRQQARQLLGRDRQRDQADHLDRRADQPARAQRHHRGRPGRRRRQGLRGGRRARSRTWPRRPRGPPRTSARRVDAIQADTADRGRARSARSARSSTRSTTTRRRSPRRSRSRRPPPTR